jgi:L-methionine (R)-S-oxide reductase
VRPTVVVQKVFPYTDKELVLLACDALSQSEIVLPLKGKKDGVTVGVLDLDSTVKNTFDDEDRWGLERIVALLKI